MSWNYRKSVKFGPGRLTFSKSGISYSVGVKGARITTGPRGTYVTLGRSGIYYRQRIGPRHTYNAGSRPQPVPESDSMVHTITSDPIDELTDTDSKAFVDDLNAKAKRVSYFTLFCVVPALVSLTAFLIYFSQDTGTDTKTSYFITIGSATNVNVRQAPNKNSPVIGSAVISQRYDMLDTTDRAWNKIRFSDTAGYVSKHFSRLDSAKTILRTYSRFETDQRDLISVSIIGTLLFIFLGIVFHRQDRRRLLVEINYEFDDHIHEVYGKFLTYFNELLGSDRTWQYLHSQRTYDYKHHAGAGSLVSRVPVRRISPDHKPAKFFRTNIAVPNIKLKNTDLYFFPERLIIKRDRQFAAIFYQHLRIDCPTSIFIEESGVPSDAVIVGYTWKYPNKDGSPDRRFNNNRRIPECRYSQYQLSSNTGINEIFTTSKIGAFDNFAHLLTAIGKLQQAYSRMG